jgi:hypothetical protein
VPDPSTRFEPLALLLLRSKGVASSYVAGLHSPVADVAAVETDDTSNATAAWVADNITAVRYDLDGGGRNLTVEGAMSGPTPDGTHGSSARNPRHNVSSCSHHPALGCVAPIPQTRLR